MKVVVYWYVDHEKRKEVCRRLGIQSSMTVNGESTYEVDEYIMKKLRKIEEEGIIQIRKK